MPAKPLTTKPSGRRFKTFKAFVKATVPANVQEEMKKIQASRKGKGQGNFGNSEQHAIAGSIGGKKISRDREHMAAIGRKGGLTISRNKAHMATIGRKGGSA